MRLRSGTSAVAIDGRAVLIDGPSGSGKSSLALGLIDRGAGLIGDDGVRLDCEGDVLVARPPPRITGLVEVRNLGLLPFPTVARAAVALLIKLDPDAPRFIEEPDSELIEGVAIPAIALTPHSPDLALKTILGLDRFGLQRSVPPGDSN